MSADSLRELQTAFREYVMRPASQMQRHIVGDTRVDASTRLAIYANAYRLRLIEALDANFPVLHKWIGGEEFERLALTYLDAYPSRHYSIRWFGNRLPVFMSDTSPWRERALWCELAHFEWAMSEAFDAEETRVVDVNALAAVAPETWPGLRFGLHPSLHQLTLRWNTPALWHALGKETPTDVPEAIETDATSWIVWRKGLSLYYRSLSVDEAWALAGARSGHDFSELCEGLCEWVDAAHVPARAAGFLRQWVEDQLLTRVEIDSDT